MKVHWQDMAVAVQGAIGPGEEGFSLVLRAAYPHARLAGVFQFEGEADPIDWLAEDHPNRVNLILEHLGRPERIAP